jgi:hypothetical protein
LDVTQLSNASQLGDLLACDLRSPVEALHGGEQALSRGSRAAAYPEVIEDFFTTAWPIAGVNPRPLIHHTIDLSAKVVPVRF